MKVAVGEESRGGRVIQLSRNANCRGEKGDAFAYQYKVLVGWFVG